MGMVVIQPKILVPKLKKTKAKSLRCTGYLTSTKNPFLYDNRACKILLASCLTAVLKHIIK